ncbi:glycosyltransferase family 2 protein [Intrasporangium flavum]|uniref:glycosyltransferase family 2 protein n=1 Tax=Intrasporangium flavum TaxID=1428657 RepID=UPI00096F4616|nr:glycosyltransferase family 2 protein [Intrasporangium flavum]
MSADAAPEHANDAINATDATTATPAPAGPLLTVISNVYDDAERLPRAVASALAAWDATHPASADAGGIEVLVVDDGSTDDTGAVADRLAASDPRVRVVHRGVNDGAPGAPRNLGIAEARGTYVAFCDSDDEYLPGTLRRLADLAVARDADVAVGGVARFNERTGRTTPLPATEYVSGPVEPLVPGSPLWQDTIAVAKVIRRAFLLEEGIRFPERILYEDQPFTVALWARARRIATLPDTVYLWYVNNVAGEESITARRHEIANFHDRITANRAIDAYLEGRADLTAAKLDKFVRHDLALYGKDLDARDEAYRSAFVASARGYLADVPAALRAGLEQPYRLVVRELVDGTPEGAVAACLFAYRRRHLDRPLESRGERWWWPYRSPEASGPEHDLTDVVRSQSVRGRHLATVSARTVTGAGARLALEGVVVDGDRSLGSGAGLRLELVDRDTSAVVAECATRLREGRFTGALVVPDAAPGVAGPSAFTVRVSFARRGVAARLLGALRVVRAGAAQPVEVAASVELPTLDVPGADGPLHAYRTRNGNLALRPLADAAAASDPSSPSS